MEFIPDKTFLLEIRFSLLINGYKVLPAVFKTVNLPCQNTAKQIAVISLKPQLSKGILRKIYRISNVIARIGAILVGQSTEIYGDTRNVFMKCVFWLCIWPVSGID